MKRPATIESDRLDLVVLLPAEIEALIAGDIERAGWLAGVRFPQGWPNHADARNGLPWHLRTLQAHEEQAAWRIRVIVERSSRRVIGSINLKGPPNADGDVEIGWGLVEDSRRRGYASEAAGAVVAWVLRQPGVSSVSATVPEENLPSQRLAAKLGLVRTAETRRDLPLWSTMTRKCSRQTGVGCHSDEGQPSSR
jgi:[ribosomal protein S5]-alanine N-acetyltransferase